MKKLEKDMKPKFLKDLGKRKPTENSNYVIGYGLYECQYCGKEFETEIQSVKSGNTKSCGCLRGAAHGLSLNKFYKTWCGMLQRCNNPKIKAYKNYGGSWYYSL